jgi:hypothetical protein
MGDNAGHHGVTWNNGRKHGSSKEEGKSREEEDHR